MKNNRLKKPLAFFLMLTLVLTTCGQSGIYSVAVNADETEAAEQTVSDSEISDSVQSEAVEEASSAETENDQAVSSETESSLTESVADENNQPEADGTENQTENQTEGQTENQDDSQTAEGNSSETQNPEQNNQTDNTSSEEAAEPDNNAEPDNQSSQKDNDTAESSEADDFGDGIDGEDGTEDSKAEEQQPDLSADVETADVWEASLPKVGELTGVYAKDILAAAKSQLGYKESTKNYQLQEDGQTKKGYTRYGAWYGEPYTDWSAVFVSFCLHYAGVPENVFPQKASCPQWIELLSGEKYNLYRKAGSYVPKPGDLVFFDKDHDGEADHVGIVSELTKNGEILTEDLDTETPDGIRVIEGDVSDEGDTSDSVKELKYSVNDTIIMGYGSLTDAQPDSTEEADEPANDEQQTGEQKTDEQEENSSDEPEIDSDQITKTAVSGDYTVTVTYNKEANIPDDTELVVKQIETANEDLLALKENIAEADGGEAEIVPAETETGTSENADVQNEESDEEAELVSADAETGEADDENVQAAGQKTSAETVSLFRLKIGFMKDSEEIEPKSTVSVRVDVEGGLNIPDDAQVGIVHYKDDGDVVEVIRDVKISSEGTTETLFFDLDSFSTVEGYYQTMAADDTEETYSGYVSALSASITADGTADFTAEGGGSTDGNDENGQNGVVRTFDTIEYQLVVNAAALSDTAGNVSEATLNFEMTLPMGITQAEFDLEKMSWLGNNYIIEYLDKDGNVVGTKDSSCKDGEYYVNDNKTTINDNASGSDQGGSSYQVSNIVSQRITGSMKLQTSDTEQTVIPGTQTLSAGVKVLNAKNGDKVTPDFKVWIDGNMQNLGYASGTEKSGAPTPQDSNKVSMSGDYDQDKKTGAVTVSAGALYNTEIKQSSFLSYQSWFDFSTGKELTDSSTEKYSLGSSSVTAADVYKLLEALGTLEENWGKSNPAEYTNEVGNQNVTGLLNDYSLDNFKEIFSNIRFGRMYSYGVALQMANRKESGGYAMKGLSLPEGKITLDVQAGSAASSTASGVDTSQYYSVLWDYKENVSNTEAGKQGRNLTWQNNVNSRYARQAVPFNKSGNEDISTSVEENSSCYDGGKWSMTGTTSASTGNNTIYSFEVSEYDFDLDNYKFPQNTAGSSGDLQRYTDYEYNFSSGQMQVLSVYPRTNVGTVNVQQTLTVGNLSATTISNQTISKVGNDDTIVYDYEINTAGEDNTETTAVVFYRPGTAFKHNSFVKRRGLAVDHAGYWLGTEKYQNKSYDAAAFVNDKISIMGDVIINEGSDVRIKAVNLLQLFDSTAFSIDENMSSKETQTAPNGYTVYPNRIQILLKRGTYDTNISKILYAADPDYKNGYDTNDPDVQAYMNTVREEDLIYFTSLEALEDAGYTCIGVLAELRNCNIEEIGFMGYCALRIPVKVNDGADIAGRTYSTVNSVNVWVQDGAMVDENGNSISWSNGKWDDAAGKNTLEGYTPVTKFTSSTTAGNGNGFVLNNGDGTSGYVKAEFADGNLVEGTHKGGYYYGCTLTVLDYKAGITINSDADSYDLAKNRTVTYTLSTIRTDLQSGTETSQDSVTSLEIDMSLSGKRSGKTLTGDALDAELLKNCYSILVDDGTKSVALSESEGSPTTVYYRFVTTTDAAGKTSTEIVFSSEPVSAGNNGVTGNGREEWTESRPMTVWVDSTAVDGKSAKIHIDSAPVGYSLPNIAAQVQLNDGLSNNDTVTAAAAISGTGDCRAYETVNGNIATSTVKVIKLGASALMKTRSDRLIEQNGEVTYTITYTNRGTAAKAKLYLYDLLPYNNDIRGTDITGSTLLKNVSTTILDASGNTVSIGDLKNTDVTIYYSTISQTELRSWVEGFSDKSETGVDSMLLDSDKFTKLELTTDGSSLKLPENIQGTITCIYAVVTNLNKGYSLKLDLTMGTKGNKGADNYGNLAWAFDPNEGSELRSSIVQTTVVSRSISGRVWFDSDWDGVYDAGEPLVSNVECTLFKWDEEAKEYKVCKTDVTGADISTQTTGEKGAYNFTGLADGKYVVAFKLKDGCIYKDDDIGATTYQVNGKNDSNSNDGVALGKTKSDKDKEKIAYAGISAGEYAFAIAYSLSGTTPENMLLHTIKDYGESRSYLKNYQENYEYQDLGLSYGSPKKLPTTGGMGTYLFTIGGTALVTAAVLLFARSKRKGAGKKRRR